MDAGRLIVGYDSCNVYDATEVRRCFHCNEFQHIATNCKNQLTCPKSFKRCVNCLLLNKKDKTNFDVNHSVWDVRDCQAYQRLLNKIKSEILGIK
jgi:chorismate mutase